MKCSSIRDRHTALYEVQRQTMIRSCWEKRWTLNYLTEKINKTPCDWIVENVIGGHVFKIYLSFYGNRKIHKSSPPSHPVSARSILILPPPPDPSTDVRDGLFFSLVAVVCSETFFIWELFHAALHLSSEYNWLYLPTLIALVWYLLPVSLSSCYWTPNFQY